MDIQSESKQIAGSIILWCCDEEDKIKDENYPSHIVENLLQRQKGELIEKAYDWLNKNLSRCVECYVDDEVTTRLKEDVLEDFKKAMEV